MTVVTLLSYSARGITAGFALERELAGASTAWDRWRVQDRSCVYLKALAVVPRGETSVQYQEGTAGKSVQYREGTVGTSGETIFSDAHKDSWAARGSGARALARPSPTVLKKKADVKQDRREQNSCAARKKLK